jgi:prophage regulatory protein
LSLERSTTLLTCSYRQFSSSTFWLTVKASTCPAPGKLSAGVTAWRVEDVRAWMAALDWHDAGPI